MVEPASGPAEQSGPTSIVLVARPIRDYRPIARPHRFRRGQTLPGTETASIPVPSGSMERLTR
jgi:hypothetical protein